jgi:hypothetical protein
MSSPSRLQANFTDRVLLLFFGLIRVRFGIQNCQQKSVSPWNYANFVSVGHLGRFVANQ